MISEFNEPSEQAGASDIALQPDDCRKDIDARDLDQAIELWDSNVLDLEVAVGDAYQMLQDALLCFQAAVRERDRGVVHRAHLIETRQNRDVASREREARTLTARFDKEVSGEERHLHPYKPTPLNDERVTR